MGVCIKLFELIEKREDSQVLIKLFFLWQGACIKLVPIKRGLHLINCVVPKIIHTSPIEGIFP